MIVYRITNHMSLDGKGSARQLNNRWNGQGTKIVYTAGSIALAKGEMSRRIPLNMLPDGFYILTIEVPDDLVEPDDLPDNWDQTPPGSETKAIGDQFVNEGKALALRVPSVFDKYQSNYLLNPAHPRFAEVKILKSEPLYF